MPLQNSLIVVTAHLDKLANYLSIKMQIIHFSTNVSSLVGVFRSLSYDADLQSSSLLNQTVQKFPPNLKESWSLHTVKRNLILPTMLDFNDWLKERAEGHDRMKTTYFRSKPEDTNSSKECSKDQSVFKSIRVQLKVI